MITVLGLGPGSLSRVPGPIRELLLDDTRTVVVRTLEHPAAAELADLREVVACDDLYEAHSTFDDVYDAIVSRLVGFDGSVVYAVPGSPSIGEFAVRRLLESGAATEVIPAESFVDAILAVVGYDPLDRGLQILNGHELPSPLVLDKPTIIAHVDRPEILADAVDAVARVVREDQPMTVVSGAGAPEEAVVTVSSHDVDPDLAGFRTSLFLDPEPSGLVGAVHVMNRLRRECPWDREQTHESLVKNLVEETYELVEAIGAVQGPEDWVALSALEEELGDVLLQVLFHAAIGAESGAFDIDGIGSVLVQKLVRRHPHVFGNTVADTSEAVKANWDRIKASEKTASGDSSALDGVPSAMPALHRASKIQNRAAKLGFDWEQAEDVFPKIEEELAELQGAVGGNGDVALELGDLLFAVVNLSRHLGVDTELSLRAATEKFEARFRSMEREGPLQGLSLEDLEERWRRAKTAESR